MNCKFCGARIGILERWRFGDFCTKEHKDEFAEDLVRLNEQIVQDLRRLPKLFKAPSILSKPEASPSELDLTDEPVPPEGGFVAANQPVPCPLAKPAAPHEEPPPKPTGGDQWRAFSKIADWEGLPPSARVASQKKQSRFVWVHAAEQPVEGPQGCIVPATYPAFLPHPELRKWLGQMPAAAIVRPQDPARLAALEARTRAVPAPRKQWIDEDGWRWIPERASVELPDFRSVLMQYPMVAPWAQWGMASAPSPIASMQSFPAAGHAPGMPDSPAAVLPVLAGQPQSSGQPLPAGQPLSPVQPVQPVSPVQSGVPVPVTPAASYPSSYAAAPPAGPSRAVPPGSAVAPLFTSGPGVYSAPASQGTSGPGAYPAPMAAYPSVPSGYAVPQPWGSGLAWRELPPPFFSALVDIAHELKPLNMAPAPVDIPPQPDQSQPPTAACRPRLSVQFDAGLPWVDCQGDPSEELTARSGDPRPSRVQPRTLWRRQLALPKPVETVAGPRIPNTAAPRFVLALRAAPPLPAANPVLLCGRWHS